MRHGAELALSGHLLALVRIFVGDRVQCVERLHAQGLHRLGLDDVLAIAGHDGHIVAGSGARSLDLAAAGELDAGRVVLGRRTASVACRRCLGLRLDLVGAAALALRIGVVANQAVQTGLNLLDQTAVCVPWERAQCAVLLLHGHALLSVRGIVGSRVPSGY